MVKKLLLVDLENVPKVDMSTLDESFRAIVYVGANQGLPKAAKKPSTEHKFRRVEFQRIEGVGKNALDFHIACQLGRTFETAPDTLCYVLAKDKGYDPLLAYLAKHGMVCERVESMAELQRAANPAPALPIDPELTICARCGTASTIPHHGGRWCSRCGCFASPPDPTLLPSSQPGYIEPRRNDDYDDDVGAWSGRSIGSWGGTECGWCHQKKDMSGGIYDDGEWMCGDCVSGYM